MYASGLATDVKNIVTMKRLFARTCELVREEKFVSDNAKTFYWFKFMHSCPPLWIVIVGRMKTIKKYAEKQP